jgi:hypothetical protein
MKIKLAATAALQGAIAASTLFLTALPAMAQTAPAERPTMRASELSTVPVLDGNVSDDPAWESLQPATGFWQIQPNDGQPASQKTEVFIGYDSSALYIGVMAYDDDPSGIVVSQSRRDAELDDTDAFAVVIDGVHDRQNGYVFGTTPAGLQHDGQVIREGQGGQGSQGAAGGYNKNWDGNWEVASAIHENGWSTEYRIPFNTLRYVAGDEQLWGINFQRNIRRNNEIAFWAPLARNRDLYRVSEAGTISGVVPPPQKNLLITPYALGSKRDGGSLTDSESNTEFGIDLKYSITPSLTLDATYNTDFAQVEADDVQINLDRFNLFFEEKCPFFLENAGQFTVGNPREVELFFSRRIGIAQDGSQIPIEGGARLSGKIGGTTNVGLLYMADEGVEGINPANNFAVARVNQELPNRSSIGALIVTRDGDGSLSANPENDENQTYALDGRWGIGENTIIRGWAARTKTPGRQGKDDGFSVNGDYNSAKWWFRAQYTEVGGDFNPEVGFLARSDYKKRNVFGMYRYRPEDFLGLLEVRPHISATEYHDFNGFKETGFTHIDIHWQFKNGAQIDTGGNLTYEGVKEPFEIVPGVIIPVGVYDQGHGQLVMHSNEGAPLSVALRLTSGGAWGGTRKQASPTIRYRFGETFSAELAYNYNKFDLPYANGDFTANLKRLRLSYAFTPKILLQALIQHNEVSDVVGTNLRFSWLQTANSGLYLVYNEVDDQGIGAPPKGREFIVKYSYIFDVFN